MRRLYRWLLWMYPAAFRVEFGTEMEGVFADARVAPEAAGRWPAVVFYGQEFLGLIGGAVRERLHGGWDEGLVRRFTMSRNRFRYSWAAIAFMTLSLATVLTAIHDARTAAQNLAGKTYLMEGHTYEFYRPDHLSFLQTFGFAFGVTVVATVAVVVAMFALRRSGVHRLEEAKTWPAE